MTSAVGGWIIDPSLVNTFSPGVTAQSHADVSLSPGNQPFHPRAAVASLKKGPYATATWIQAEALVPLNETGKAVDHSAGPRSADRIRSDPQSRTRSSTGITGSSLGQLLPVSQTTASTVQSFETFRTSDGVATASSGSRKRFRCELDLSCLKEFDQLGLLKSVPAVHISRSHAQLTSV